MDEIEILHSLGAVPVAPASERARVRATLMLRIEQASATGPGFGINLGRRLRRPAVLAIAALVAVGAVSAVGAAIFLEWGPVDHPATPTEIRAEIAETKAVTPLPPGQAYPDLYAETDPDNLAQYLGVQKVQFFAMCAWSNYWLDAHRAGDDDQMAAAVAVIERFPTWKSIADPRLADDSIRTEIDEVVVGARAGDAAPVELLIEAACLGRS